MRILRGSSALLLTSVMATVAPACLTFGGSGGTSTTSDTDPEDGPAFTVEIDRKAFDCGTGSLTLDEKRSFSVVLEIDEDGEHVVWKDGDGERTADLTGADGTEFEMEVSVDIDMRAGNQGLPPCTIRRTDSLELTLDDSAEPKSFEGTLIYHFEPTEGSDCSDLLYGPDRLVEHLPCGALYDVTGAKAESDSASE